METMGPNGFGMEDFLIRAEEEGLSDVVTTRDAKINSIVNKIRSYKVQNPYGNVDDHIDDFIESEGLDIETLSQSERAKIDRCL